MIATTTQLLSSGEFLQTALWHYTKRCICKRFFFLYQ